MSDKKQNHFTLIKQLADGSWHNAQDLSALLPNPDSLNDKIKYLKSIGLNIEPNQEGKAYQIPGGLELLDQTQILAQLSPNNRDILSKLILLDEIDSTNSYLLEQTKVAKEQQTIACLAEYMSQGRGRFGRRWVAPFGRNIYLSLLWPVPNDIQDIGGLPLVIAVAVIRGLTRFGIQPGLSLKWPNDVFHQGKKLAGILLEMASNPNKQRSIVIGVGINADMPTDLGQAITQAWTSLLQINHERPARNRLAAVLLDAILQALSQFTQQGLTAFLDEWRALDHLKQKHISLNHAGETITGIAQGISDKGELIIEQAGQQRVFLSGEVAEYSSSQINK